MSKPNFSLPSFKGKSSSFLKAVMTLALAATVSTAAVDKAQAGPKTASIVIDVNTGKVMESKDPDGLRYPASLTKMMTLYMVFDALESGRISLNSKVPVSRHAAAQAPSKLGVRAGQTFTVEQGILALVTRSANDCATAFAEFLGGSEPRFGKLMTAKARSLGMSRTIYVNANGLPDPRQVTTARDQARLGIALRKHFPQYYSYFSTRSFRYGKQVIGNHNRLVGVVRGVDGIKTGYTRAAGFNLATSAKLDGRSVVGVVLGYPSGGSRDAAMRQLIQAYLPQAARGGNGGDALVSMASKTSVRTAYAEPQQEEARPTEIASAETGTDLPHAGPVPGARYDDTADVDNTQTNTVRVVRTKSVRITKSAETDEAQIAEPAEQPVEVASRSVEIEKPAKAVEPKVDAVTTASTSSDEKGWVIQVGVASGKSQAQALLDKAKDKGGKVLRAATPFTVAFSSGSGEVYRARFGGFSGQDQAVKACKQLKRKGVSCWASLQ